MPVLDRARAATLRAQSRDSTRATVAGTSHHRTSSVCPLLRAARRLPATRDLRPSACRFSTPSRPRRHRSRAAHRWLRSRAAASPFPAATRDLRLLPPIIRPLMTARSYCAMAPRPVGQGRGSGRRRPTGAALPVSTPCTRGLWTSPMCLRPGAAGFLSAQLTSGKYGGRWSLLRRDPRIAPA